MEEGMEEDGMKIKMLKTRKAMRINNNEEMTNHDN